MLAMFTYIAHKLPYTSSWVYLVTIFGLIPLHLPCTSTIYFHTLTVFHVDVMGNDLCLRTHETVMHLLAGDMHFSSMSIYS